MDQELNRLALSSGLIGGLALFLFGLDIMARALKQLAGSSMRSLLARMTANRFRALVAGAVITATVQSSSVTTVLLVGFISAGLMTTAQSVAVIFGANIGSTFTAQILAFKISTLALPILSAGFFMSFIPFRKSTQEYGRMALGIGLVFFGMTIMSDTMLPLRSYQPFLDFMRSLDNVLLALLAGAGFTALIQSSAATTGILIVMAGAGLIELEAAVALALGANIGTCVTALLAAIGKPREAVRAALVHTLFNILGVLIWISFIDQLAGLARAVTPDESGGGVPRQLANVHTFFNLANALIFIGFTAQFSRVVELILPDRPVKPDPRFAPRHLDPGLIGVPAIALDATRLEILRLGQMVREMLEASVPAVTTGSQLQVDRLHVMDRPVDLLHREIISYLRKISLGQLPEDQSPLLMALMRIANDLEHIGDLVATGLVTSARKRAGENVVISPATAAVIQGLQQEVVEALDGVLRGLETRDRSVASDVRQMKAGFSALVESIAAHEADRLRANEPMRLNTYAREIELTETFDDIFRIIRRIARAELAVFEREERAEIAD